MKRSWAELSRVEEIRGAARGWKAAAAIDAPTLAAIDAAYPDPRLRLHGFWRVLVFVLISVIVNALFFFIQSGSSWFALSLVFGVVLAGATEGVRGSRHAGTGADAATSFWSVTYLLAAAGDLLFRNDTGPEDARITAFIAITAGACALAAWRWGFAFYAVGAAAALFFLLARPPGGRILWIGLAVVGVGLLSRAAAASGVAPAHRRCLAAAFAASAVALYVAINLFSVDRGVVEALEAYGDGLNSMDRIHPVAASTRRLAALATALYPVIFLGWGVRSRRRIVIGLGLLAAAASAVTLRYYVHIAPLWEVLAGCGAILIGAAIAIQRAVRGRPNGEWRGLTAAPLYDRDRGISPLAAIVAHSIGTATRPAAEPESGGLTTGGGRYGGGGASGSY